MERLSVAMFHLRRLAQKEGLNTCAAQLTSSELLKLKELLGKIKLTKPEETHEAASEETSHALVEASSF